MPGTFPRIGSCRVFAQKSFDTNPCSPPVLCGREAFPRLAVVRSRGRVDSMWLPTTLLLLVVLSFFMRFISLFRQQHLSSALRSLTFDFHAISVRRLFRPGAQRAPNY